MRTLEVLGVRVELPRQAPLLLLREVRADDAAPRYLPIWIGAVEAAAVANALERIGGERPSTHELMVNVLAELSAPVTRLVITGIVEGTFFAELTVGGHKISCRPSDGIALALRSAAPILCSEDVLDEAGVVVADDAENEVARFREFLNEISPEDFTRDPEV